jgi:hypothetical protein
VRRGKDAIAISLTASSRYALSATKFRRVALSDAFSKMNKFIETTLPSCLEHNRRKAKEIQSFCDGTSQRTSGVSEGRQLGSTPKRPPMD